MRSKRAERTGEPGPVSGFTVLELLVAAGLTAMLATLLLALGVNLLGTWNRTQGHISLESRGQRVLDQLARDLQGAWRRDDGSVWLAATVQPGLGASGQWGEGGKPSAGSLELAAATLADMRFGVAGVWLRLFTTPPGADLRTGDPAAPVAVSYQIIRRTLADGRADCRYLLYRAEISSAATFDAGYDLSADAYRRPATIAGAPGNLVSPLGRQVLAEDVIDFGVRIHGRPASRPYSGTGLRQIFPDKALDLEFNQASPPLGGAPVHGGPCVIDVMLRMLTTEGARQIAGLEGQQRPGDWWEIARTHSRVFTRRIVLPAAIL